MAFAQQQNNSMCAEERDILNSLLILQLSY